MGAVPVHEAYRLRSANRATSPVSANVRAATTGPNTGQVHQGRAGGQHHLLQLAGERLDLLLDHDQVGELFGGEPAAGLPRDVAWPHRRQDGLGLAGVMSFLDCPGTSSDSSRCTRFTHWIRPASSARRSTSSRSASRCRRRPAPAGLGAHRDHRDGMRVMRRRSCGCARCRTARTRAESFAGTSTTCSPSASSRCANGRPAPLLPSTAHPIRVGRHVLAHRRVPGLVRGEPPGRQHRLALVNDLDRRRQLVGIDPDEHPRHELRLPAGCDRL